MKITYEKDQAKLLNFIQRLCDLSPVTVSIRCHNRGGKIIPLTFQAQPIIIRNQSYMVGIIRSGLHNHIDAVSGLPDAFLCENACDEYIDKPEIDQFLLGILCLDHIPIAHEWSSYAQDIQFVHKTVDLIQSILPERAGLYRLADNQFAIICTACSPATFCGWEQS